MGNFNDKRLQIEKIHSNENDEDMMTKGIPEGEARSLSVTCQHGYPAISHE